MKLAIVVGHNHASQGAVRQDTGETEFSWNSHLAMLIYHQANKFSEITVKTFFRQPADGYTAEIKRVYREVDSWGADASCELHFNSHTSREATGTEVLSSGSTKSLAYASAMQDRLITALKLPDRGVKIRRSGRGSESLISGRCPAVLIEPFFGSSPKGLAATDELHEKEAIARAILLATKDAFL